MKGILLNIFLLYSIFLIPQGGFRTLYYSPGSIDNRTQAIFETTNGNFIGGGTVVDTVNGYYRIALVLTGINAQGKVVWAKKYRGTYLDYVNSPWTLNSFYKTANHIYFAGVATGGSGPSKGLLFKFDFNGDSLWHRTYSDTDGVVLQAVTESIDGGLLLTGWFQNSNAEPCLIMKTDANGNELWRKRIPTTSIPDVSDGKAIIQDSASKKIALAGYQYITLAPQSWGSFDHLLILDSLGNMINRIHFSDGQFNDMIQTSDKKLLLLGSREIGSAIPLGLPNVTKIDINNPTQPIWRIKDFGIPTPANGFISVIELSDGDFLIGGNTDTAQAATGNINTEIRFTKISKAGKFISNTYYNYMLNNYSLNITPLTTVRYTSDGGLIAAFNPQYMQLSKKINPFFFVKYDSTGCDTVSYYCKTVGIEELRSQNNKFKIFPNPVGEFLTIESSVSEEDLSIKIKDVVGKEIKQSVLTNQNQKINVKDLPKGIYFLQVLENGKIIATEKIIKE